MARCAPPPLDLQILFQEGEKHERKILIELQRAGIQVIEQQASLEWRALKITGHIDATVSGRPSPYRSMSKACRITLELYFPGGKPPVRLEEVARLSPEKPWLRKYLGQVTLYSLWKSCELGILLCVNKDTGALAR